MFIRKRKYNRPLTIVLLTLFIFSAIGTQSAAFLDNLAKAKSSTSSKAQFPFDKNEKEEKQSSEEKSLFGSLLTEWILSNLSETSEYSYYADPYSRGEISHIPLYLFNRTLLI